MKNKMFVSLVMLLLSRSFTLTAGNTWGKSYEFCAPACTGDIDTLKAMVQSGMSVNTTNKDGASPLGYAIACHQVEAARFLLEQRASVTDMVAPGQTPITVALEKCVPFRASEMLYLVLRCHPSRHTLKDSEEVKLLAAKLPGDPIITMLDDAIEEVEKPGSSTIAASILTTHNILLPPIIGLVQSFISTRPETPRARARTLQWLHDLSAPKVRRIK